MKSEKTAKIRVMVVEDHIRTHLIDREAHSSVLDTDAIEQLVQVVRSYFK